MVQGQQPLPQRDQDKGDDCGLQEKKTEHPPILIDRAVVEQVESFKFLGVHITKKLMVQTHQDSLEEGTTKPIPLRKTIWHGSLKLYSCTIESFVTGCITAWYGNCSASDRKALQRVVRMAQCITGGQACHPGPLYQAASEEGSKNCQTPVTLVILFSLLPHGKQY